MSVVDADIDRLRAALADGLVTSVELVARYLNRIGYYDRSGIRLNAVPVLNPAAFDEARAADIRRARGHSRGPLDGIPFTAKDSYCVAGLSVAAGSPAFRDLVARHDAFAIARLRSAGAVFLGLTNMPPLAAGGMQRGVYGRAESPYNADFLTSAFGSGSSNGSGTATAASFAAFGLGEETWSSGRAPASNNSLVAYTPSRGMISVRGNWPLVPTMDVVVPHTRSVRDLKHVLDAVVWDDADTGGDLWRTQPWIRLPRVSDVRPASFAGIEDADLSGVRLAVPRIYINADPDSALPIRTRDSIMDLWREVRADLEAAGAEVVETDFPVVENYEKLHADSRDFVDRGFVTREFLLDEIGDLSIWAMDSFLRENADPALPRLAAADRSKLFPAPPGSLPDRYGVFDFDIAYDISEYVPRAAAGVRDWTQIETLEHGLRGLERTRLVDFEAWLQEGGFDAVLFPAAADVGPADADVNPASAEIAWRNGVWVSNGNLVPRHLGIPTVTIPLGVMSDTRMPVGLTVAGPAYADTRLVQLASAIAHLRDRRVAPPRTPALEDEVVFSRSVPVAETPLSVVVENVTVEHDANHATVRFVAVVVGGDIDECAAFVDGVRVPTSHDGERIRGSLRVRADAYSQATSEWLPPYGPLVVLVARDRDGGVAGALGTSPSSPL